MWWEWVLFGLYGGVNVALVLSALQRRRSFREACERWDDVANVGTHARGRVVRGRGLGLFHPRMYVIEFRDIEGGTHTVRQQVSGPWLVPGASIEVRYPGDVAALGSVDPRRAYPTWRFTLVWLFVYPVLSIAAGAALVAVSLRS